MIISASRRTDIPTYYSEWFFNRIKEGYALVRNPMNAHQISKISLRPDVVDGIVFWTKNPTPMMTKLDRLKDYTYYFQFTLNAYGQDVEASIPSKNNVIIPAFQKLSDMIGPEKVIWRYDPIFLNFWISTGIQKKTLLGFLLKSSLKICKRYLPKVWRKLQKVTALKWILAQKVSIYKNMESIMHGV